MFPTTVWDMVREAGARDPEALERFAQAYREPVLDFLRARGAPPSDREDLCQEVFVRLLKGGVLAKADANKGTFRSLLRTITLRIYLDWRRRKKLPTTDAEPPAPEPDDFDRGWALHLLERALTMLKARSPGYHEAIERHLNGEAVERQRLWIARKKLRALIRHEVALTCRGPEEIDEEWRCLAPYLEPRKK